MAKEVKCIIPDGIDENGNKRTIIQKILDVEIINWHKINTYKFWPGLCFTICHPIYSWRYDKDTYGTFLNRIIRFFKETCPKYTPFSKACRWLANNLVHNIPDTKYINTFYCRKRGDYTTYYSGKAYLGYYVLYKLYFKKCGRGYAEIPKKTKIASGWVFTKKKAIEMYKAIVSSNLKIYMSEYQPNPEIANPWVMYIVTNMNRLLQYGDEKDIIITSHIYEERFKKSNDTIEKLWCYVAELLSCPNDFYNHEQLAHIFMACDHYLYYKEMKKNPMIDQTFKMTLERCGEKEAKKWQRQCIKDHSYTKSLTNLTHEINKLEEFYLNQPFDYYRI